MILACLALLFKTEIHAEGKEGGALPPLFFDSETSHFDRHGKFQEFEGNVIAMIGGNLISADVLKIDRENNKLNAKGHVLLVSGSEVLGGDSLDLNFKTEDFFLTNAFVVTEDAKRGEEITRKILGVSPEEIQFEADKSKQLDQIREKKKELAKQYPELAPSQKKMMVDEYALLIEKEELIAHQKNSVLAQLSADKRGAIERRRDFWEQSKKTHLSYSKNQMTKYYSRLDGAWIERTEGNHYRASRVTLTPCRCEDNEKPAWGLRSDTIEAYSEGYADLDNAVLEIKGIPVLYFPYLRIPMKGQRQSGLLFPNLSYSSHNGTVFTQPVFFDLGRNKDVTTTFDFIEKRGTRLGGEFRYQQKTYSGWQLNGEFIRDKSWLETQQQRDEINRAYLDGLQQASATYRKEPAVKQRYSDYSSSVLNDPAFWSSSLSYCLQNPNDPKCEHYVSAYIKTPDNNYRYKAEWKGMNFFTPKISFVSHGRVLSDHRYLQDLYFEHFNESFNPATPDLYVKSKAHLHLDGNDIYAGVGTSWGDSLLKDSQYSGHQIPAYARIRTRFFTLFEGWSPVYGSLLLNYKKIQFLDDLSFSKDIPNDALTVRLDSGNWTQTKFTLLAPIVTEQIFTLNYFTELEARVIEAGYRYSDTTAPTVQLQENLSKINSISSSRLGLDFKLPIDGTMRISPSYTPRSEGISYLNHRMTWGVLYSVRPSVVRRGLYSEAGNLYAYDKKSSLFLPDSRNQKLSYFTTDGQQYTDSDFITDRDIMVPHQQVVFSLNNDWQTYKKTWSQDPKFADKHKKSEEPVSFTEAAMNDLEYSEHLAKKLDGLLTEKEVERNGFTSSDGARNTFAHLDGNISYDFRKAELYHKNKKNISVTKESSNLAFPWSPARFKGNLSLYDWTLTNSTKYDLFQKVITELGFQLSPPSLMSTRFTFGYSIEKEFTPLNNGDIVANRTLTQSFGLTTTLVPYTTVFGQYNIRLKENQNPSRYYYTSAGATFASPSSCWGLQFWWRRDYGDTNWAGTYFLSLLIKFFSYDREFGNFLTKANQNRS